MRLAFRLLLLALVIALACALASCSRTSNSTITTQYYPLVLMPDDTLLLSSDFTVGAQTEIRRLDLRTESVTLLGRWKGNPYLPIDNHRLVGRGEDDQRPQIYLYDLTTMSRKLIADKASLERVGKAAPDGSKLLFKRNGLNVVDLATGRSAILLDCPVVDAAAWYGDSRHVVASCNKGKTIRIIDTKTGNASPPPASMATRFAHGILTPDTRFRAYLSGARVICECLKTGKQWVVSDQNAAKDEPGLIFSPNGSNLLVWYYRSGDMIAFDASTQRTTKAHIDLPVPRQLGMYWLNDNATLLITSFARDFRSCELTTMLPASWPEVKQARNL